MYGTDKKWRDIMIEMENHILQDRERRGAGDKPKLQKYDPNYSAENFGTQN